MSRPQVRFHEIQKNPSLRHRMLLRKFIPTIFTAENKILDQLTVIFCSDQYLVRLNREYLNHNTYTDIITFDLSAQPGRVTGELYISTDRLRENASFYKVPFSTESYRVVFHGILHLCGYRDKRLQERALMRLKEDYYIRKFTRIVSRETRST